MTLKLPKEQKQILMEELARYLEEEHDLRLGSIAAEGALDFVLKLVTPVVHNQAIQEARAVLMERLASLEDEFYALEKPLSPNRGR